MSDEPETIPPMLIDKEKAFEIATSLWRTLADMNRFCNIFMSEMEKAGPLTPAQDEVMRQWCRAMSSIQVPVLDKVQAAEVRPDKAAMN